MKLSNKNIFPFQLMHRGWQRILMALAILTLTGCASVGPAYQSPELELSSGWHTHTDPAILPKAELVRKWWTLFHEL